MILRQRIVATGQFLFRFRSYIPMLVLVVLVGAFWKGLPRDSGADDYFWRAVALCVTAAGLVLRFITIGRIPSGTSGRNTKRQKASTLNTTGTYSIVRNPLYLANGLVWAGIVLLLESPALTLIFAGVLLIYYAFVVFAEEDFLARTFGNEYMRYAAATPALMPRFGRWKPWNRAFSWRMVIRREHDSVFSAVTGLVIVFHCHDVIMHGGRFMLRREWLIPWLAVACAWAVAKILKKHTHLLRASFGAWTRRSLPPAE
jgi:protein-S-isoprenylcysteine O-methyltransferase Ste14